MFSSSHVSLVSHRYSYVSVLIHCPPFLLLTGSSRQNNVEEIFSLIKFLRISPLNDWPTFNTQIAKPVKAGKPGRALKRLQACVQSFTKSVYSSYVRQPRWSFVPSCSDGRRRRSSMESPSSSCRRVS